MYDTRELLMPDERFNQERVQLTVRILKMAHEEAHYKADHREIPTAVEQYRN